MAGYTAAYANTVLDLAFADTDYLAYSENGSTEVSNAPRSAIDWAAAGSGAKSNAADITTTATGAATIAYVAVFSAAASGTQKTDWEAVTSKTLATDDTYTIPAGSFTVTQD